MIDDPQELLGKWLALRNDDGTVIQHHQVIRVDRTALLLQQETDDGSYRFENRYLDACVLFDTKEEATAYIRTTVEHEKRPRVLTFRNKSDQ